MIDPDIDPWFATVRELGGDTYAAFLAAGYREWYSHGGAHSAPLLLQKCIRGDNGTKLYYIDVWVWDWSMYPEQMPPVSYSPEVQFNTHGGQPTFDVSLYRADSPEQIEAFFAQIYAAMGCEPYGD